MSRPPPFGGMQQVVKAMVFHNGGDYLGPPRWSWYNKGLVLADLLPPHRKGFGPCTAVDTLHTLGTLSHTNTNHVSSPHLSHVMQHGALMNGRPRSVECVVGVGVVRSH